MVYHLYVAYFIYTLTFYADLGVTDDEATKRRHYDGDFVSHAMIR